MSILDIHDPSATLVGDIERVRRGEEIAISDEGKPIAGILSLTTENSPTDWKAAWRRAAGRWKDRADIPELMAQLKQELNPVESPDNFVVPYFKP